MPFAATLINPEIIILSKVSQTTKREISYHTIYMWNLETKKVQMNLFTKQSHRCRKQPYGCWGEVGEG